LEQIAGAIREGRKEAESNKAAATAAKEAELKAAAVQKEVPKTEE
jgi:hypothetical protein